MRVVLDTNVLIVSISRKAKHHNIFKAILEGKIQLCISNAIIEEYQEIIAQEWSYSIAQNTIESLLVSPNVLRFDPHYQWTLIYKDPDDDKFVDCAIASGANFIITNDKHFNVLKELKFPPINVISADDFLELINSI